MNFVATRELVGAAPWSAVAFTTYALSLSFFEAVVLDQLIRSGSATPVVFADVAGVRSALAEHGARRVGRDYDLEPVALAGGVFHPKVTLLADATDGHLVVGSGNLTFGGWMGNLECVEHLHPSFAADAFADAEDFFMSLAVEDRLQHEAFDKLESLAAHLRRAAGAGPRHGKVRLLHSLSGGLSDQIADQAAELGGAVRLVGAAPFWDDGGRALGKLCAALGLDHAYVHAHPFGVVQAGVADNWPRGSGLDVHAVRVSHLADAAMKRPLHAKMFEVMCQHGRLLVSGSANGSKQALGARGNVEAVVLRIWREPQVGWGMEVADPLPPREISPEAETETLETVSILRAELDGERLKGRVFGAFPAGLASALQVSVDGAQPLGDTTVGAHGAFTLAAGSLEIEAWRSGRLILRLVAGSAVAEGFVAFRDLQEVRRRGGAAVSRLLAVMGHMDAPEDALAMMAWFQEHPEALALGNAQVGGGGGALPARSETFTDPAALLHTGPGDRRGGAEAGPTEPAWRRFIARLLGALAEPRQTFDPAGDDAPEEGDLGESPEAAARRARRREREAERRARQSAKAMQVFETVFEKALEKPSVGSNYAGLLAVTQYVCHRLAPDPNQARTYLNRLVEAFIAARSPEALPAAAAAVVVSAALEPSREPAARRARGRLLKLGWDTAGPPPDIASASGFLRLFALPDEQSELWSEILAIRTAAEDIREYRHALEAGIPRYDLRLLSKLPEGPLLAAAYDSPRARGNIRFVDLHALRCPCSYTALPKGHLHSLQSSRIVCAPCGHVLLCEAD